MKPNGPKKAAATFKTLRFVAGRDLANSIIFLKSKTNSFDSRSHSTPKTL